MEGDTSVAAVRVPAFEVVDWRGRVWLWASLLVTLCALGAAAGLAPLGKAAPARSLTLLLFLGSSVHVAATGYLFTEADVRAHVVEHRVRYVWIPASLVLLTATVAAAVPVRVLTWLLLPYFAWQFFHFSKQNVGMLALASTSTGRRGSSVAERRVLSVASMCAIAGLVAHPELLQLSAQTPLRPFYGLALVGFLGAIVSGLALLVLRPRRERSTAVGATYLMALLFFGPVFLFRSPYAAVGGITIAHGLQYLLLVGLVAAGRRRGVRRAVGLTLLLQLALLGGILLSAASHLHDAPALGRILFGAYLGTVMAHFVIDAGIWRLRDPFPRAFLGSRLPFLVPQRIGARSVIDRYPI